MLIIGIVLALIGGALIETPIIGLRTGNNGLLAAILGPIFGLLFLGPGLFFIYEGGKGLAKTIREKRLKDVLAALAPGFKEAKGGSYLDKTLSRFRAHYSEFFGKAHTGENEKIQEDVTQIYRNIMQFHKNRLNRLGLTCEMLIRRMEYSREDGITDECYSDGKYNIISAQEEIAAKTIYKKNGKDIYTKIDRDTANYTIIQAKQVGKKQIVCPSCGTVTNREALLDGCDYCGTKFKVEDLGSKISAFAFRPDYALRYEKYLRMRNRTLIFAAAAVVVAVFMAFGIYGLGKSPEFLALADGGIVLTSLALLFATVIAAPVYIIAFLIVHLKEVLGIAIFVGLPGFFITKKLRAAFKNRKQERKEAERMTRKAVREFDPNFSAESFYSDLQNKLSSVLYADNEKQLHAFAAGDLTHLFGRYSNVIGADVENMTITGFEYDQKLQRISAKAVFILTRFKGKRCTTRRERMRVTLAKSADCKTQVVCAPAVLICKGCGASLDLLQGKHCEYCGRELDLINYDWVIEELSGDSPLLLPWQD